MVPQNHSRRTDESICYENLQILFLSANYVRFSPNRYYKLIIEVISLKTLYLLGAGASANAIPTVTDMEGSIRSWTKSFGYGINGRQLPQMSFSPSEKLAEKFEWLANGVRDYGTPDIFAKSLLLSKKYKEYKISKITLATYLVLEQCRRKVDKRYFGFFSALLNYNEESSNVTFHPDIKIATWNYDLQITEALMSLTSFQESEVNSILLKTSDLHSTNFNKNQVYRLNGYAGAEFYGTDILSNSLSAAYFHLPNESRHPEKIQNLFLDWLNSEADLNFHFAWDSHEPIKNHREKFFADIAETEVLVVIGYSFPTFNRFIDSRIFSKLRNLKKAYIQDSSEQALGRVNQLIKQNHYPGKESIEVKHISNVDQFYIPSEIDR